MLNTIIYGFPAALFCCNITNYYKAFRFATTKKIVRVPRKFRKGNLYKIGGQYYSGSLRPSARFFRYTYHNCRTVDNMIFFSVFVAICYTVYKTISGVTFAKNDYEKFISGIFKMMFDAFF